MITKERLFRVILDAEEACEARYYEEGWAYEGLTQFEHEQWEWRFIQTYTCRELGLTEDELDEALKHYGYCD